MPARLPQFVEACGKSGLLAPDDLRRLQELAFSNQGSLESLTRGLVASGKLTDYQVAELLARRGSRLVRGDYTILEPLGSGGMGRVFKAVHRRMDRVVAIKELPAEAVDSPAARNRFHQEVKAAARLIHPHIVTAFDAGEQEGVPYLVMEYVDGQDLATVLKENGELPLHEALHCILQVARGLDYAHSRGIVHRDIKPGNLLLDWAGNIRILDMGLARLDATHAAPHAAATPDGVAGEIVGTYDYMAPEQAAGQAGVDGRADMYSLGCTLYRIVTGRCLYAGATPEEKQRAHREAPIPRLVDATAECPADVENLFQRMVAKEPRERPATMGQVIASLEQCLSHTRHAPVFVGAGSNAGSFDSNSFDTGASAMPAGPFDTAHESTVVTQAADELTHPATPPTPIAPAAPVPPAPVQAAAELPGTSLPAPLPSASEPLEPNVVSAPGLSLALPVSEPGPTTPERAPTVSDLAWPLVGILAAGVAAVAIGAGLVIWLNS